MRFALIGAALVVAAACAWLARWDITPFNRDGPAIGYAVDRWTGSLYFLTGSKARRILTEDDPLGGFIEFKPDDK